MIERSMHFVFERGRNSREQLRDSGVIRRGGAVL